VRRPPTIAPCAHGACSVPGVPRRSCRAVVAAVALLAAACADEPTRAGSPDEGSPGAAEQRQSERRVAQIGPAPEAAGDVAPTARRADGVIPGHYIVIFKDRVSNAPGLAKRLAAAHRGKLRFTYGSPTLKGFAGQFSDAAAAELRRVPEVARVEPDQVVTADATQRMDAAGEPWGLDRIDERWLPMSHTYDYSATGAGVRVYMFDTGLQPSHPQFGTRALNVATVFFDDAIDCNGHGTHAAGIVAGQTYGVAKGALLRGVKVLGGDCGTAGGALSGVIAAIDWVRTNRLDPAVANMSFGVAMVSDALNTAVNNLANSGVFVAVSAGNGNANACGTSPASAAAAFTVAASSRTDARASFSNYGACVDAYAPGVAIKSAYLYGGTAVLSGTSMAAPYVTGVAALYKQTYGNASTATITDWIRANATTSQIKGNVSGTPNRLVNKGAL
jgi:subtilisin family serine protease